MAEFLTEKKHGGLMEISLESNWIFANLNTLQTAIDAIDPGDVTEVHFSCGGLDELDLAGAWVLYEKSMDFEDLGIKTEFKGFKATHFKFLQHIIDIAAQKEYVPGFFDPKPSHWLHDGIRNIGSGTIDVVDSVGYIARAVLD